MKRARVVLAVLGVWAVISVVGLYRGCACAALPPAPSPDDMARVRATRFRASVGVERYVYPVYSERLIESLRRTGLFDAVVPLEELPDAALVARVERTIYGTATVPVLTAVSLGFIPTTVEEEWGESFSLRRNASTSESVPVDFSYGGPSTLGWWAAVRSLSPDVTTDSPPKTDRFRDALSVAIVAKSGDIAELLE